MSLIVYDEYQMQLKEKTLVIIGAGIGLAVIGFVFYKHVIFSLLLSLNGLWFPRLWVSMRIKRRKDKLLVQFRQALYCLSSSLTAGKSIENAFRDALDDLKLLFIDPASLIVREFGAIVHRLDNGEQIEKAVADFARRANIEDISNFADVLVTCKRTGGNLVEVMRRTSAILSEKLEVQTEISVMLAQKKFESTILLAAPIGIIAILSFTSADYMEPLFQGAGRIIMTASLGVLCFCLWLTRKLMRIAV